MQRKKILATALVASSIASVSTIPAQTAHAASLDSFISIALSIANDDSHGYNTYKRWGPDYDCSSFVITALKEAGFETGGATYTGNMVSNLTKHGFSYIPSSKIDLSSASNLQAGDILMASGHTELYIGNGKRVGAHKNYDGKTGDSGGNEISVQSYSRGAWYGILRYTGASSSSAAENVTASSASSGYKTGTYKINANLNLRSGNSTSTSIITTIAKGTSVSVTKVSNGWGKISYKGDTGWIYLTYASRTGGLSDSEKTATVATKTETATATATAGLVKYKTTANVNMRKGAGTSNSVLQVIPKGTSISVSAVKNNWGKFTYNGKTGWLSLDYAKKVASAAKATTTSAGKTTASVGETTSKKTSYVYRTQANVYLRKGAGIGNRALGVVPKGTYLTVLGSKDGWGKVSYNGKTGWIALRYSKKTGTNLITTVTKYVQNAASSTSTRISYTYKTIANLNMRKSHTTSSARIMILPKGTKLSVTQIKNNWGKFTHNGKTGWVYLKYAALTGSKTVVTKVVGTKAPAVEAKTASVEQAMSEAPLTISAARLNQETSGKEAAATEAIPAAASESRETTPAAEEAVRLSVTPAEKVTEESAADLLASQAEDRPEAEAKADMEEAAESAEAEDQADPVEEDADAIEADDEEAADAGNVDSNEAAPGNYEAQRTVTVYAAASQDAESLVEFAAGTIVEVKEAHDGWGKIIIEGQSAWIRLADFVETDGSATPGLTLQAEDEDQPVADQANQADAKDQAVADQANQADDEDQAVADQADRADAEDSPDDTEDAQDTDGDLSADDMDR